VLGGIVFWAVKTVDAIMRIQKPATNILADIFKPSAAEFDSGQPILYT